MLPISMEALVRDSNSVHKYLLFVFLFGYDKLFDYCDYLLIIGRKIYTVTKKNYLYAFQKHT